MGSIRRPREGRGWEARYRAPGGHYRSRTFPTAAGASVKDIAVRAGHASVASVLDRYGHLLPDADAQLRDRLDAMLSAADAVPPPAVEGSIVPLHTSP